MKKMLAAAACMLLFLGGCSSNEQKDVQNLEEGSADVLEQADKTVEHSVNELGEAAQKSLRDTDENKELIEGDLLETID